MLSYYHIIILWHYHIIIFLYYHIIILSYYHITIFSYCHIIILSYSHIVILCNKCGQVNKWFFAKALLIRVLSVIICYPFHPKPTSPFPWDFFFKFSVMTFSHGKNLVFRFREIKFPRNPYKYPIYRRGKPRDSP